MINKIIDGISSAINAEFGDKYEIYTESVEQGLKEPCFSILCLNPTIEQFIGQRYYRTNQFCIHYFPESSEKQHECNEVAEKLFECMEIITVDGDLIRGNAIHSEISDEVLSFFVNYDLFIRKAEEVAIMEVLELDTEAKGR